MVIDTENMRTSGRHGQKLHELGFGTLDAEGNWEPLDEPEQHLDWGALAGIGLVVLSACLIAWAVVEWVA
jgi:hypothetical protein